jgi:hypothetical protein
LRRNGEQDKAIFALRTVGGAYSKVVGDEIDEEEELVVMFIFQFCPTMGLLATYYLLIANNFD